MKSKNNTVDHESKIDLEPGKPYFFNAGYLYVPYGNIIYVYNSKGRNLLGQLGGHEYKVINIIANTDSNNFGIVSCDEKGTICYWDIGSSFSEAKLIKSLNLFSKEGATVSYFNVIQNYIIVCARKSTQKAADLILFSSPLQRNSKKIVASYVISQANMVDVSYDKRFIAAVLNGKVFVGDLSSSYGNDIQRRFHNTGSLQATCLQFHPFKVIMAVGSQNGAINLWMKILDKHPVKMILHWHTLPVRDLAFSPQGDLYSGGGECVLVRWYLNDDNQKSFLPRLGAPITWINTDPNGQFVSLIHSDQSISIVNAQEMMLEGVIRNMSLHLPQNPHQTLAIGILYHKPTSSMIKNGPTGHLQFFDPFTETVTYNLDVSMCNFVTNERNQALPNAEITNAALSGDGSWLVTLEICYLAADVTEVILKFWYFSLQDRRWELNTSVQQPHSDVINELSSSEEADSSDVVFATCSEDGSFKIWNLVLYQDVSGSNRNYWSQYLSREFRGLPCTAGTFSSDGSLFAASFESCITLWTTDEFTLIGTLSQSYLEQRILGLSFSAINNCSPVLISRSDDFICSWDILSCSLGWRVFLPSSCFVVHHLLNLIVVFSKRLEVFYFTPSSSQSVFNATGVSSSKVLCASFVTGAVNPTEKISPQNNKIYFFNESQKFLSLDLPDVVSAPESIEEEVMVDSQMQMETRKLSDLTSALKPRSGKSFEKSMFNRKLLKKSTAIPANNIVTELKKSNVHNVTFDAFLDSLSNFLPNSNRHRAMYQKSTKSEISYESNDRLSFDDCRLVRGDNHTDPEFVAQMDFSTIVDKCLS